MNIKKYGLLFILNLFVASVAFSQAVNQLTIRFQTKEFVLSDNSKKSIDSLIRLLANSPKAFSIEAIGHTDNQGSPSYNQMLSTKRALETVKYFSTKGFTKIKYSGKSFNEPIADNSSESGKQKNRRVDIIISIDIPKIENIGGFKLKDNSYKVTIERGGIIEQPSGTKIIIPSGAFVDKNGKEVKGDIEIRYSEYSDPVDFIFGNIPMSYMTNGQVYPFNSAGMFKILAYKNGQPIYLKEGKNIQIDYAVTENLADLNFYRFDTVSHQWAEIAKLTDQHGTNLGVNEYFKQSPCGWINGSQFCKMDECDALYFIANKGIKYAGSIKTITEELQMNDSINSNKRIMQNNISLVNTEIRGNQLKIDSINKYLIISQHHYKVKKVKINGNKTSFEIKCIGDVQNEFTSMSRILWIYDSNNMITLNDSIFRKEWTECVIIPKNLNYSIELKDSPTQTVFLENVQMTSKDKVRKKERDVFQNNLYVKYDSILQGYQYRLNTTKSSIESLLSKNKVLGNKINLITPMIQHNDSVLKILNRDSLFCFWDKSKKYMSEGEQHLKLEEWIEYFDKNKAEMLKRYESLKTNPQYAFCEQMAKEKIEIAKRIEEQAQLNAENKDELKAFMRIGGTEANFKKGEDLKKTKTIFQSLSIQNLGVYNCDQIYKLKDPVITILADYQDLNKNKLSIILIYIIDDSFNGILRYDGYDNFGPSAFKCSASSHNTMIAFDEKFTAYIYRPDNFKMITTSCKYTFTLEKLANLKSKADLK